MLKSTLISIVTVLFLYGIASCDNNGSKKEIQLEPMDPIPEGKFMGIEPSDTPQLLFPGFINTPMGEYNGTFNSAGSEFFFTASNIYYDAIVHSSLLENGEWSRPEVSPFSAPYNEFDPLFSPDGLTLYFSSHRPIGKNGNTDASNIWKVDKVANSWSDPEPVFLYGPKRGNYFSSLTTSGDIYFNIWNTGDMFKAIRADTGYVIRNLGNNVNSTRGDGDPFIAPDESYLIFRSTREGGMGNGDLWISFNNEGVWTSPQNLGEPINSKYHEMCPYVTTNGKLFIFSSGRFAQSYYDDSIESLSDVKSKLNTWDNGQQNIYAMSASFIDSLKIKILRRENE